MSEMMITNSLVKLKDAHYLSIHTNPRMPWDCHYRLLIPESPNTGPYRSLPDQQRPYERQSLEESWLVAEGEGLSISRKRTVYIFSTCLTCIHSQSMYNLYSLVLVPLHDYAQAHALPALAQTPFHSQLKRVRHNPRALSQA